MIYDISRIKGHSIVLQREYLREIANKRSTFNKMENYMKNQNGQNAFERTTHASLLQNLARKQVDVQLRKTIQSGNSDQFLFQNNDQIIL